MKNRFWAVIIEGSPNIKGWEKDSFCFTWDRKHPENQRKEKTVKVWAVYPLKKDALADARFRGGSFVKEVFIESKEICICVAIVTDDGQIIRGQRHHDCIRALADRSLKSTYKNEKQGFITSLNRYVTRKEGMDLQLAAGIKSADPGGYRGDELYSEDLY